MAARAAELAFFSGTMDRGTSTLALQLEVLCRDHHRRRMTARTATAATLSPETLPLR